MKYTNYYSYIKQQLIVKIKLNKKTIIGELEKTKTILHD
jgi:hypothetical protein